MLPQQNHNKKLTSLVSMALVIAGIFVSSALAQNQERVSFSGFDAPIVNSVADVGGERGLETVKTDSADFILPEEKRVVDSLSFEDADIQDVLKVLREKTGLIFDPDYEVLGRVSVNLHNIDIWDALRIILNVNRLAYEKQGYGVVRVMTAGRYFAENGKEFDADLRAKIVGLTHVDQEEWVAKLNTFKTKDGKIFSDRKTNTLIILDAPQNVLKMEEFLKKIDVPLENEDFQLKYARINDVKELIKPVLTEMLGEAKFDEKTRTITVTDTRNKLDEIAKIIQEKDRKIELTIDVSVIQVRLNEDHQEGVDWEAIVSNYQNLELEPEADELGSHIDLSIGTITKEDYSILLEALDTVGSVRDLSEEHLNAVVNFDSRLNLSIDPSFKRTPLQTGWNTITPLAEDVSYEGYNVLVGILPLLPQDGELVLNLSPQLQFILADQVRSQNNFHQKLTADESLDVSVHADDIIVIGGLRQEREVAKVAKVPFLGNLPVLGTVFRHENKYIERVEYVIFLQHQVLDNLLGI